MNKSIQDWKNKYNLQSRSIDLVWDIGNRECKSAFKKVGLEERSKCLRICIIADTIRLYNEGIPISVAYEYVESEYFRQFKIGTSRHTCDACLIRNTPDKWEYWVFPIGWFVQSLNNIDDIVDGVKKINPNIYLSENYWNYMRMCAGAVFLAKSGAPKQKIYEYVKKHYDKVILEDEDVFPTSFTEALQLRIKTPKAKEYGILNFTLDNIPMRISEYSHTSTLTNNLLTFFENSNLKEILNGLSYDTVAWSIGAAYYGVNGSFNNCCLRAFPELTDKLFSTLLEYKPTPNKEADEQWLAEYREKAANREMTEADEPFKEPSKLLVYIGTFLQLANYNSENTHRGIGVPVWSIIVYIALMLAVSIMEFNWLGWIFITLFFMSFVWKGGE